MICLSSLIVEVSEVAARRLLPLCPLCSSQTDHHRLNPSLVLSFTAITGLRYRFARLNQFWQLRFFARTALLQPGRQQEAIQNP